MSIFIFIRPFAGYLSSLYWRQKEDWIKLLAKLYINSNGTRPTADIIETSLKTLAQVVIRFILQNKGVLSFKNSQEMTHEPMLLKDRNRKLRNSSLNFIVHLILFSPNKWKTPLNLVCGLPVLWSLQLFMLPGTMQKIAAPRM